MKSYPLRKKSQYDWLGEIPSHWNELFLQQVSSEKCVKNKELKETNVLSLSYGNIVRKKDINFGLVTNDFSTYQIVEPGDIILRFTDLQNDQKSLRTGLVCERGIITSAYVCIKPSINSAYLRFLLHAYDVHKIFYGLGGGIRQSIGFKDVRHMFVLVPPRSEQDQIVRYLDWQVSRIDKLIEAKKREIDPLNELKLAIVSKVVTRGLNPNVSLKDSGVDWLKRIPIHWECKKIRSLFTYRNEKVSDKVFAPLSVSKMGVVPQLETAVKSDAGDSRKLVRTGDFVINSRSDRKGSCGISELDGSVSLISIVLEPHKSWNKRYVHYLLRSQPFSEEFFRNGRGIVDDLWTTRYSEMKNILLPVPPRSEQDQIVCYLDYQVSRINKLVEEKKKQIDILQEFKIKIVSYIVTGKYDVRNIVVKEF